MDKFLEPKNLPRFALTAGIIGWLLRRQLYVFGMDGKGLLVRNHPLELLLWGLTAVSLGLIVLRVRKLAGSNAYGDNFGPSKTAAVCHGIAGAAFALTAVWSEPGMQGNLGLVWQVLGLLSGPCLILAGLARGKGKQPFFALHMIPCLFLVLHIVNHYQRWSGNPQQMDYVFPLLAVMALMFFAYYTAAFDVNVGSRRMHLGMGLAAIYLSLAAISRTEYLLLYAGGLLWVQGDLCRLEPVPQEGEAPNDPS